jgi:anti-sigma B factor antagonist
MSEVVPFMDEGREIEDGVVELDMSPPPMTIDLTEEPGDARCLIVHGELDMSTAPKLHTELAQVFRDDVAQVVIDLRDISFIDSTGLGVLVSARQRAKASGVPMKLRLPEGAARFPFQVTGLIDSFDRS